MTKPIDFGGPIDRPVSRFGSLDLERPVAARFFDIAERHADRRAVCHGAREISYGEAAQIVRGIALGLRARLGAGTDPIAIALDHATMFPLAMLAVLALGRPYVPIDIAFPALRNGQILAQSGAVAVVTDAACRPAVAAMMPNGVALLDLSDLVDLTAPGARQGDLPEVSPDAIAYILYTSGSTGTPKGVFQNQRNLLHDVMQYTQAAHIGHEDRLTQIYSPTVNGAIRDIFGALLNGASLHVMSLKALGIAGLVAALEESGATIYHSVPVILRQVLARAAIQPLRIDGVRLMYLAGDRLDRSDIDGVRRHFPRDALVYTGIGSTENATIYRHWFIARDTPLPAEGPLPVGRAIPDRSVTLLDEAGAAVPDGEVGEIAVTSRYMALGYWRQPELTAKSFQPAPGDALARVFRPGDLGRIEADGLLRFLGRKDQQIKLSGHRIELAEVEAAFRSLPAVAEGAILIRHDDAGIPSAMAAYWTAAPGMAGAPVREALAVHLPARMLPAEFVEVPSLPMLDNFKIDRKALAAWDALLRASRPVVAGDGEATLDRLIAVCADVLERGDIGPAHSLAGLNVDSLQLVKIELAMEKRFGWALSTAFFLDRPRLPLGELAGAIDAVVAA